MCRLQQLPGCWLVQPGSHLPRLPLPALHPAPSHKRICREFRLKFAKDRISMGRLETINFSGMCRPGWAGWVG